MPVHLMPLLPFFGRAVNGKLIDLSAGGMAIVIRDIIPQGTKLDMTVTFPDKTSLNCTVEVKRVVPKAKSYLHGIEFLNLQPEMVARIEKMSSDYIDCEARIQSTPTGEICKTSCAFFNMCTKPQRINPVPDPMVALDLAFRTLV